MAKKSAPTAVVPSSFELAGFEWIVKFSEDLTEIAKCDCHSQTIVIRDGLSEQTTQQAFYHELVHAIMFTMGHMTHDEVFTDAFGGFLHQFAKTQDWS